MFHNPKTTHFKESGAEKSEWKSNLVNQFFACIFRLPRRRTAVGREREAGGRPVRDAAAAGPPSPPRRTTPRGRQPRLRSVAADPPAARTGAAASLDDGRQSGGSERPAGGQRGTPLRLALPPRHGGRRREAHISGPQDQGARPLASWDVEEAPAGEENASSMTETELSLARPGFDIRTRSTPPTVGLLS